ncbi:type I restriction enzyme S subunit [Wenyingzhuangia heitensis]|uniref:Type I restriction enzyme S subunit n=1 Tax=Wenyingzhuangia heitensis TaxID=1487859 RepID=A0ABX0U6H2_9FLAO|nr:restriction endonuclease subunit S [Wenyingzhuangia heitensis]NIJ44449.1 type I restriction enzyme S subunit [Wenyingzhuangia heitensis]
MSKEWKEVAIENIGEVIGGGTPSSKIEEYWGGNISWITPKDLSGYNFKRISKGSRSITDLGLLKSSARLLPKNTVLITSRAPIGYVAIADKEVSTNQGFKSVILKSNYDTNFIYYLIKKNVPALEAVSSGSTFKEISGNSLKKLKFKIPPLAEQKAIAKILGDLDAKIELNRKMNETLENMAQALFQSWFVDFDPVIDNALAKGNPIPEPLQAKAEIRKKIRSEVGILPESQKNIQKNTELAEVFPSTFVFNDTLGKWIPEGWEVKTINDVTTLIIDHRGKTPKKLGGDWVENGHPAISAKNIKKGNLIRPDMIRYVDEEMYEKWMKDEVEKGDIIITSEAPMGEMFLISDKTKYCLSQRLYCIRANETDSTSSFLYYWLQSDIAKGDLEGRCTGTTVTGIKQSELRKVSVMSPDILILQEFEDKLSPFLERKNLLQKQTETLIQQREVLLPQLISGKVKVPQSLVQQMKEE